MKNFIKNPIEYGTTPIQPDISRDQKYRPRQRLKVDGTRTTSSAMLYQDNPMKVTRVIWSMSPSDANAPDIPFIRFCAVSAILSVCVWGCSLSYTLTPFGRCTLLGRWSSRETDWQRQKQRKKCAKGQRREQSRAEEQAQRGERL